jgi:hypothetical protein
MKTRRPGPERKFSLDRGMLRGYDGRVKVRVRNIGRARVIAGGLCRRWGKTAGPSTTLRSGRDDKVRDDGIT